MKAFLVMEEANKMYLFASTSDKNNGKKVSNNKTPRTQFDRDAA